MSGTVAEPCTADQAVPSGRTADDRWPDDRAVPCYWPYHKPAYDIGIDGFWPDQGTVSTRRREWRASACTGKARRSGGRTNGRSRSTETALPGCSGTAHSSGRAACTRRGRRSRPKGCSQGDVRRTCDPDQVVAHLLSGACDSLTDSRCRAGPRAWITTETQSQRRSGLLASCVTASVTASTPHPVAPAGRSFFTTEIVENSFVSLRFLCASVVGLWSTWPARVRLSRAFRKALITQVAARAAAALVH